MSVQLGLFERVQRDRRPRPQICERADALAVEGEHTLVARQRGVWVVLTTRSAAGDTGAAWAERCRDAARDGRVRVYDRASICTWDSATPRLGYVLVGEL